MVVPNVDNIAIDDFRGLDIERAPATIEEGYLTRASNFVVRGGDLIKRPPFRKALGKEYVSRTGNAPYVLAPCRALPSVHGEMVTVGPIESPPGTTSYQARIYPSRDNESPDYTGSPTLAAIAGRSFAGADFVTVAKVGIDYYFGGPGGLWRWVVATNTWTQVTLPDATSGVMQVVYFKNRLWIVSDGYAGAAASNSLTTRLYYSAPANPTSIVGTINIAFNESLGHLKAVVPYSDRLLCFTDRSIWNLYLSGDVASWSQRLFLKNIGTHNPQSVIEYNGMVYFLNHKGLWKTDGNILEEVSAPVRRWIKSKGLYDWPFTENSICLYKDFLIVRINRQGETAEYSMFLYNLEWNAWSGCEVNDILDHADFQYADALNNYMVQVFDQDGDEFILAGTNGRNMIDFGDPPEKISPDGYYVDLRDIGAYQTVSYNTEFRTKHFDNGKMPRLKDVLCAQVELRGTDDGGPSSEHTFTGWWFIDSDLTTQVNQRVYSGLETDIVNAYMYSFPGARYGRRFSFNFRENSTGYAKVLELNIEAVLKRDAPENPSA